MRQRSVRLLDELFFNLLDVAQPTLFVEAGAFEASASLRAAEALPGSTVIAFEANPENYRHFTTDQDFAAHGVTYLNLALTDEPGPITFHLESSEGSSVVGHSSTLPRNQDAAWRPDTPAVPIAVEGVRLDDTTPDAERVAMWVDVEGASCRVLAGAAQRLAACDVLKIEVEEEPFWEGQALSTDVVAMVLDAGLVPVARDIENPDQYHIVFASARLLRQRAAVECIERFISLARDGDEWTVVAKARAHPAYGRASVLVRRTLRLS